MSAIDRDCLSLELVRKDGGIAEDDTKEKEKEEEEEKEENATKEKNKTNKKIKKRAVTRGREGDQEGQKSSGTTAPTSSALSRCSR